jgi:anti-sigma B factor antagonist
MASTPSPWLERRRVQGDSGIAFSITCGELDDGTLVVEPQGNIDAATAPELRAVLGMALADSRRCVIVDLGEVGFMDTSGLRVLLAARDDLARNGGSLMTVSGNPGIRKIFESTRTADSLQLITSRSDAVRRALAVSARLSRVNVRGG